MAITRFPSFILDCDDPGRLATFYGALLDWKVSADAGWAEVRNAAGDQCICFQRVDHYRPPEWPGQDLPQQLHIDVMVDDLEREEQRCCNSVPPRPSTSRGPRSASSSTRLVTRSASACRSPADPPSSQRHLDVAQIIPTVSESG